ncbi:MAG TPA: carbohydrate kinase family protein [Alphaproteobacteria bacterium]|jgi:sugar/nucleoside kinase (ribokinase family)|nr:carbohydrate kinase family protein [Alphaproteobacteria bacterium]
MGNFDLLSIGDASIDTFMTPIDSESICKIDTKECLIAFPYGAKIPVRNLDFSVGGNAANNAVGTRRLGINSGIVLTLGDDSVGNMIIENLRAENVDLTYVIQQPETNSNYSSIVSYSGERTIFVYHAPRSYEFPVQLPVVPWVYLTSLGESFKPFQNHLVEWLRKNPTVKLAFNPGSWQMRAGVEVIAEVLALSYMIYVNREEAMKLTNLAKETPDRDLLIALNKLGPKICIITDGGKGAIAYNSLDGKFFKVGVLPVDAYERTGAGDAFGSASLSALIHGKSLDEALVWGTVNSASVIGYTGAQKGLLKESELPLWIERAKSSGVVVESF